MNMRRLLTIAMPFMRQSGAVAIVMNRVAAAQAGHGKGLYGLPCARCGLYYAADLAVCPVCNSTERVFPKLKPPAWPASVPPKAADVPRGENLRGLATINRQLLARRVQPLTILTTAEAMPALA
jgi:hypothetical protein